MSEERSITIEGTNIACLEPNSYQYWDEELRKSKRILIVQFWLEVDVETAVRLGQIFTDQDKFTLTIQPIPTEITEDTEKS